MNSIFITVRSNSKRLPNKAYKKINNKYTIEYVILQAKKSKLADSVVLCTTNLPEDDLLCKIAVDNNIQYFRGSEIDKLERWNGACKKYGVDFFVTADGDDLFCSHELFDLAISQNNEKLGSLLQQNNSSLIDKTTLLLTDVLPKNNESQQNIFKDTIVDFQKSINEDTKLIMSSLNKDDKLNEFLIKFSLILRNYKSFDFEKNCYY